MVESILQAIGDFITSVLQTVLKPESAWDLVKLVAWLLLAAGIVWTAWRYLA